MTTEDLPDSISGKAASKNSLGTKSYAERNAKLKCKKQGKNSLLMDEHQTPITKLTQNHSESRGRIKAGVEWRLRQDSMLNSPMKGPKSRKKDHIFASPPQNDKFIHKIPSKSREKENSQTPILRDRFIDGIVRNAPTLIESPLNGEILDTNPEIGQNSEDLSTPKLEEFTASKILNPDFGSDSREDLKLSDRVSDKVSSNFSQNELGYHSNLFNDASSIHKEEDDGMSKLAWAMGATSDLDSKSQEPHHQDEMSSSSQTDHLNFLKNDAENKLSYEEISENMHFSTQHSHDLPESSKPASNLKEIPSPKKSEHGVSANVSSNENFSSENTIYLENTIQTSNSNGGSQVSNNMCDAHEERNRSEESEKSNRTSPEEPQVYSRPKRNAQKLAEFKIYKQFVDPFEDKRRGLDFGDKKELQKLVMGGFKDSHPEKMKDNEEIVYQNSELSDSDSQFSSALSEDELGALKSENYPNSSTKSGKSKAESIKKRKVESTSNRKGAFKKVMKVDEPSKDSTRNFFSSYFEDDVDDAPPHFTFQADQVNETTENARRKSSASSSAHKGKLSLGKNNAYNITERYRNTLGSGEKIIRSIAKSQKRTRRNLSSSLTSSRLDDEMDYFVVPDDEYDEQDEAKRKKPQRSRYIDHGTAKVNSRPEKIVIIEEEDDLGDELNLFTPPKAKNPPSSSKGVPIIPKIIKIPHQDDFLWKPLKVDSVAKLRTTLDFGDVEETNRPHNAFDGAWLVTMYYFRLASLHQDQKSKVPAVDFDVKSIKYLSIEQLEELNMIFSKQDSREDTVNSLHLPANSDSNLLSIYFCVEFILLRRKKQSVSDLIYLWLEFLEAEIAVGGPLRVRSTTTLTGVSKLSTLCDIFRAMNGACREGFINMLESSYLKFIDHRKKSPKNLLDMYLFIIKLLGFQGDGSFDKNKSTNLWRCLLQIYTHLETKVIAECLYYISSEFKLQGSEDCVAHLVKKAVLGAEYDADDFQPGFLTEIYKQKLCIESAVSHNWKLNEVILSRALQIFSSYLLERMSSLNEKQTSNFFKKICGKMYTVLFPSQNEICYDGPTIGKNAIFRIRNTFCLGLTIFKIAPPRIKSPSLIQFNKLVDTQCSSNPLVLALSYEAYSLVAQDLTNSQLKLDSVADILKRLFSTLIESYNNSLQSLAELVPISDDGSSAKKQKALEKALGIGLDSLINILSKLQLSNLLEDFKYIEPLLDDKIPLLLIIQAKFSISLRKCAISVLEYLLEFYSACVELNNSSGNSNNETLRIIEFLKNAVDLYSKNVDDIVLWRFNPNNNDSYGVDRELFVRALRSSINISHLKIILKIQTFSNFMRQKGPFAFWIKSSRIRTSVDNRLRNLIWASSVLSWENFILDDNSKDYIIFVWINALIEINCFRNSENFFTSELVSIAARLNKHSWLGFSIEIENLSDTNYRIQILTRSFKYLNSEFCRRNNVGSKSELVKLLKLAYEYISQMKKESKDEVYAQFIGNVIQSMMSECPQILISKLSSVPLLLEIDEEYGKVTRESPDLNYNISFHVLMTLAQLSYSPNFSHLKTIEQKFNHLLDCVIHDASRFDVENKILSKFIDAMLVSDDNGNFWFKKLMLKCKIKSLFDNGIPQPKSYRITGLRMVSMYLMKRKDAISDRDFIDTLISLTEYLAFNSGSLIEPNLVIWTLSFDIVAQIFSSGKTFAGLDYVFKIVFARCINILVKCFSTTSGDSSIKSLRVEEYQFQSMMSDLKFGYEVDINDQYEEYLLEISLKRQNLEDHAQSSFAKFFNDAWKSFICSSFNLIKLGCCMKDAFISDKCVKMVNHVIKTPKLAGKFRKELLLFVLLPLGKQEEARRIQEKTIDLWLL